MATLLRCWLVLTPLRGPPALFTMKFSKDNQPPRDLTQCPKCGKHAFYVLETRSNRTYIRRRKHCKNCKHRETFYEISQNQYQEFQKKSKELEELMIKLRKLLLDTNEAGDGKDNCKTCTYARHGQCTLGFPEAFTPDAYDCSAYIHKT